MVPFLKIFCLAGTISTISVICSPLLIAIGKPHLDFFFNLLRLIVMPIGFLVGVRFGLIGVAYVWLTLYPLLFLVIAWITIKSIDLSVGAYARQLRNPVVNTLLMAAAIVALQRIGFGSLHVVPKIILSCTIGVLVYICFSFIFDRTLIREIREGIVLAVKHRGEELA
jgi:O-antigen/teichoic acid export membrane protein